MCLSPEHTALLTANNVRRLACTVIILCVQLQSHMHAHTHTHTNADVVPEEVVRYFAAVHQISTLFFAVEDLPGHSHQEDNPDDAVSPADTLTQVRFFERCLSVCLPICTCM